eukprot:7090560-Alexandrium_andersonii.AAC.1
MLLLVGLAGQAELEHELSVWLQEAVRARARRSATTQQQRQLSAWAWLLRRAGIAEAARRGPDLYDRAVQQ